MHTYIYSPQTMVANVHKTNTMHIYIYIYIYMYVYIHAYIHETMLAHLYKTHTLTEIRITNTPTDFV